MTNHHNGATSIFYIQPFFLSFRFLCFRGRKTKSNNNDVPESLLSVWSRASSRFPLCKIRKQQLLNIFKFLYWTFTLLTPTVCTLNETLQLSKQLLFFSYFIWCWYVTWATMSLSVVSCSVCSAFNQKTIKTKFRNKKTKACCNLGSTGVWFLNKSLLLLRIFLDVSPGKMPRTSCFLSDRHLWIYTAKAIWQRGVSNIRPGVQSRAARGSNRSCIFMFYNFYCW